MQYAIIVDDAVSEYPVDPVARHPNTSFPANWPGGEVEGITYVVVQQTAQPVYDPLTQNITEGTPALNAGVWSQTWIVTDASQAEIDARAVEKRAEYQAQIDAQRRTADRTQVDLRYDPGLIGLIDDANSRADAKLKQLGYVPDSELATFDPDISTAVPSSVDLARSLALQERAWVQRAMDLSAEDETALLASADAHEAIVKAGDASADVPLPPSSFRRMIGVFSEGFGNLELKRTYSSGWWWLEGRITTERDLAGGQYWLAIYSDAASDTAGDTAGYLTTAQLTPMGNGIYAASKSAINLPRPTPDDEFLVTLCYGHLSAEQFDRVHLIPGDEYELFRVRFGGDAV